MKKVIYTVLTGGYDKLKDPEIISEGFDYICFTDNASVKSKTWDIRFLENSDKLSPVRLSRLPKILPHQYLSEYDYTVYVDANVIFKKDITPLFEKYKNFGIALSNHPHRNCIYTEEKDVLRCNRSNAELTNPQIVRYREEGFPEDFGLSWCNVIFRKNNSIAVHKFNEKWWQEVSDNSHRDQLSFDYVRWLNQTVKVKRFGLAEKLGYFSKRKHSLGLSYPNEMKTDGIDVVYPLGVGSPWNNNELRYSIRSVKKHFKDLRNIVIVGRKPRWAKNVVVIHVEDNENYRDANLIKKMIAACKNDYISENFIWAADDKFMCEDVGFDDLQGWFLGEIEDKDSNDWFKAKNNTRKELVNRGLPQNDYNSAHAFQPMNKKEFLEIISTWKWEGIKYTGSNIYNNSTQIFNGIDCEDVHKKLYKPLSYSDILKEMDSCISFNINADSLNDVMKHTFQELYPDASEYELNGHYGASVDPYQEYVDWLKGKDFKKGVSLIANHTKNRYLVKYFNKKGETPVTSKQLEKNLLIISRKWKKLSVGSIADANTMKG